MSVVTSDPLAAPVRDPKTPVRDPKAPAWGPMTPVSAPKTPQLVLVELRKMVDTRAGLWLMLVMGIGSLATVVLRLSLGSRSDRTFANVVELAEQPMHWLLPVIGILLMTSEWSQRTALTTFALVPRRLRVIDAKFDASGLLALAGWAVGMALAAAGFGLAKAFGGTAGGWHLSAALLRQSLLAQVCAILVGAAFGLALRNSAPAIVAYFVLPTLWAALGGMIPWLRERGDWLDVMGRLGLLMGPDPLTGRQWEQLGTSMVLWCLLPMVVGLWQLHDKEIS